MDMRTIGPGHNRPPAPRIIPGQPWPGDAQALIFQRERPVTTAGRARTGQWVLRFERRTPPVVEPLMGWTAGDDTLAQVELTFDSRDQAVAYAEREGLPYRVAREPAPRTGLERRQAGLEAERQGAAELYATAAALAWLDARYGVAAVGHRPDLDRALSDPASVFASPSEVVHDPTLSPDDKHEVLRRWAWNEWLRRVDADNAPAASRLDEVKSALEALGAVGDTHLIFVANERPTAP